MSQVEHHQTGITYWRGLEQLAETPEVRDLLSKEFPGYDPAQMAAGGAPSRRRFLKLMGASMALAGVTLTGCRRWPEEKLAPYTANTGGRTPGSTEQYATSWELGGVAHGLLVTSFDGRPIKVEGNPSHPSAWTVKDKQASADAFAQASVLEMYDPQRSRQFVSRDFDPSTGKKVDRAVTWDEVVGTLRPLFDKLKAAGGAGFAILCEDTASPSVVDMRKRLKAAFPKARWFEYEPLTRDNEIQGSRLAFGRAVRSRFQLDKAAVVVSLDADLLGAHPAHIRHAADWSEQRRGADDPDGRRMNRVYMAESAFTITGSVADVRLPVDPARVGVICALLAMELGLPGAKPANFASDAEQRFVHDAAADLKAAGGNALVAVGPSAAPEVHALAHAINQHLGAVGKVITLVEDPANDRPAPADGVTTHFGAISHLRDEIIKGSVQTLLILGGNPAYDAPLDVDFAGALTKVPNSIRLGLYDDETSRLCKWHLPRAHYLESWGDARAWDGTPGITQPLIEPLFGGKSVVEVLAVVLNDSVTSGEAIVKRTWRENLIKGADFDAQWRRTLEKGLLDGAAYPAVTTAAKGAADLPAVKAPVRVPGTYYLKFEPDYHVYDGRFANNGWLQETGDPLTKLVWDNAALISFADAQTLGIKQGDVIQIDTKDAWIKVAAYILPGQPLGVISLSLGYGRTNAGDVGSRLGFNGYRVRTTAVPYVVEGVKVTNTDTHYTLCTTTLHHLIDETGKEGRDDRVGLRGQTGKVVREATLAAYAKNPRAPHAGQEGSLTLQLFDPPRPDKFSTPHKWGMVVDMSTCIGCNSCVVACQAENNIPVVGKDQALMHREMHWIRIDRYFKTEDGDPNKVDVVHQPMLCVHCENAPCEQVCPVAATMHDTEGLNTMVYNRCIGTRYCSNNCPYKVRRFNYFDWHAKPPRQSTGSIYPGLPDRQQVTEVDTIRQMQYNPDVTVRMRGVMEKCTYCTQRLQRAKIAKRAAHPTNPEASMILDGEVMTACQQACPTQAIVFGNLNDPDARVKRMQDARQYPRVYDVLGDLNSRPRTKHLAKLRNPAGDAVASTGGGHGGGGEGGHGGGGGHG